MARRFPKPVPRIRLTCPPEEDSFFDGPERDISTFAIGEAQESSDDDEEEEDEFPVPLIEMEDQASSCHSVNYQTIVPEGRETNDNVIVNPTENEALQALLPYCPHVLTYLDSKCPLGEDCTMQQICHSNSHRNGCSREPCKYSHDQVATCRRLFKYGHCSRQNCRYSHDQELRNTIRESIADHVDHRVFGVQDQVIEEEISVTVAGGTVNHEEDLEDEVEEIVREDMSLMSLSCSTSVTREQRH